MGRQPMLWETHRLRNQTGRNSNPVSASTHCQTLNLCFTVVKLENIEYWQWWARERVELDYT